VPLNLVSFRPALTRMHGLSPNLRGLWKSTFLARAHMLLHPDEQRDEDQARIALGA
jgi:hypothetical protein